jgi:hypothetical protein
MSEPQHRSATPSAGPATPTQQPSPRPKQPPPLRQDPALANLPSTDNWVIKGIIPGLQEYPPAQQRSQIRQIARLERRVFVPPEGDGRRSLVLAELAAMRQDRWSFEERQEPEGVFAYVIQQGR